MYSRLRSVSSRRHSWRGSGTRRVWTLRYIDDDLTGPRSEPGRAQTCTICVLNLDTLPYNIRHIPCFCYVPTELLLR